MEELKHLVRIVNTDINGKKPIAFAMSKIKGVGIPFAHAVCRIAKVDLHKKAGALSDTEIKKIEEIIKDPIKAGFPSWILNRRKDYETGKDVHIFLGNLQFTIDNDIKMLKKVKTYRGVRHMQNAPVRGQRTRSNFRANKGNVLGVKRSAKKK